MNLMPLIGSLHSRGMSVLADGDTIKVSPASALTDADRQTIRAHKAELLGLLRPRTTECPPIGSAARPRIVRTNQSLEVCPWHTCGGPLNSYSYDLYECVKCRTWFKPAPMDFGASAGDLDDTPVSDNDG